MIKKTIKHVMYMAITWIWTLCTQFQMCTSRGILLLCMTPGIWSVSNIPSKRETRTCIWRKRSILLIVHFNIRVWYSRCNWSSSCFWQYNVVAPSYFTFNRSTNWRHSFFAFDQTNYAMWLLVNIMVRNTLSHVHNSSWSTQCVPSRELCDSKDTQRIIWHVNWPSTWTKQ